MANITFKGNPVTTIGELPKVGSKAPDFTLIADGLAEKSLKDFAGKKKILDMSPSLDTGVCQTAARKFNEMAAGLPNTVVLLITCDLPWAAKRFCTAENLTNVTHLSLMRGKEMAKAYGNLLTSGPMQGLVARSIVVLDENDVVQYTELVPETINEPNYEGALNAVKK
jgi:thioredoxin-dependent peroxiredoxin